MNAAQEHEETFLKRVEQEAARGARKGGESGAWLQILSSLIAINLERTATAVFSFRSV